MARTKRTVRAESETTSGIRITLTDSGDPRDTARFTVNITRGRDRDNILTGQNESAAWHAFDAATTAIDFIEGN